MGCGGRQALLDTPVLPLATRRFSQTGRRADVALGTTTFSYCNMRVNGARGPVMLARAMRDADRDGVGRLLRTAPCVGCAAPTRAESLMELFAVHHRRWHGSAEASSSEARLGKRPGGAGEARQRLVRQHVYG